MRKAVLIIITLLLALLSVAYAANPGFFTSVYLIEGTSAGNKTGQSQLYFDTSHYLHTVSPSGTDSIASSLPSSNTGFVYATNGIVSTPGTGTPTVALGSALTISTGASAVLTSGSTDTRGEITLNTGLGTSQTQTITVNSNPAVNDTLKVFTSNSSNNVTFTFISGASNGNNIQIGATTTITASNIAARINAQTSGFWTATSNNNVVTMVDSTPAHAATIATQTVGATLGFAITVAQTPPVANSELVTLTFQDALTAVPYVFYIFNSGTILSSSNISSHTTTGFAITGTTGASTSTVSGNLQMNKTYTIAYFVAR